MQLSVKGKQIDVGDAMRAHVETQLKDITGKYFSDSLDAQVTFSREAHLFRADIAVHAGRGILLQANASASEP
jgi:ribosomal subunit interface protein